MHEARRKGRNMGFVRMGHDRLADCLRHIVGRFCSSDVVVFSRDSVRQQ